MPSGVDASSGVVAGPAITAANDRHLSRGQAGPVDPSGQGPCRGGRRDRHRDSARRAGASDIGLIARRRARRAARQGAASTKFSSGHVVVVGGSRGLMGAPAMASLAAHARRRRLCDRVRARVVAADPGCAADGGDDTWPGRRGRRAHGRGTVRGRWTRSGAPAALALGPGLGRDAPARALRARAGSRSTARAGARRRRLERPRRVACRARAAERRPRCSRRMPASWRDCWHRQRAGARASGSPRARKPPSRPARSSCSRATTRWSSSPPGVSRSAAATARRSPQPAPATCSPARSRRCSHRAWSRSPPPPRASSCTPQAGREAARRQGAAEGVIAGDVIAAAAARASEAQR